MMQLKVLIKYKNIDWFQILKRWFQGQKMAICFAGIYNGMGSFLNTEKSFILKDYNDKSENDNYIKKIRKELINKLCKTKKENKKDRSKEILKKFNKLYIN